MNINQQKIRNRQIFLEKKTRNIDNVETIKTWTNRVFQKVKFGGKVKLKFQELISKKCNVTHNRLKRGYSYKGRSSKIKEQMNVFKKEYKKFRNAFLWGLYRIKSSYIMVKKQSRKGEVPHITLRVKNITGTGSYTFSEYINSSKQSDNKKYKTRGFTILKTIIGNENKNLTNIAIFFLRSQSLIMVCVTIISRKRLFHRFPSQYTT